MKIPLAKKYDMERLERGLQLICNNLQIIVV
jgi:hypothetical protein